MLHGEIWANCDIDFPRVRILFAGLEDPAKRSAEVYVQGHWERGGYLRGESIRPMRRVYLC
jgi:hypothetical protein